MKNTFAVAILTACLITAPIYSASAHEDGKPGASSSQAEQQPFDIQFLDTMVKHHEDGIEMFKMASAKAENADVKAMAEKMTQDQEKEIPELQALRNQIKPDAPRAVNENMPGMMPMDMSKLENKTGSDFDRTFLTMTIEHHKGAIKMADAALKKSQSKAVKEKAQMMHDMQSKEVSRMEGMLKNIK
jgi:uncharacterized protein (DUF305 family)